MQIERTGLEGVMILTPRRHGDTRGFFAETYNRKALIAAGVDLPPLREEATLRLQTASTPETLTYQAPPSSRGQLLRCARGAVTIIVAEGRVGAAAYGTVIDVELSAENGRQLWVPAGRPVGWRALQDDSEIVSNATEMFDPALAGTAPRDLAGWASPFSVGESA